MKVFIRIDGDRCIGCGRCAEDCFQGMIRVADGKTELTEGYCIACGHCVSVCPTGAAGYADGTGYSDGDIVPNGSPLDARELLLQMKSRRSVRRFSGSPVTEEELKLLFEAARYAPTAGNRQKTRYIVLRRDLKQVTERTLGILKDAAEGKYGELPPSSAFYRETWKRLFREYRETGKDGLFHNPDCVVLVLDTTKGGGTVSTALSSGLAAGNIELLAHSLGIGVCYVGFFSSALELDGSLAEELGIREQERLIAAMAMGHHEIGYVKTPSRLQAEIEWK